MRTTNTTLAVMRREVKVETTAGTIIVTELSWPSALSFLKKLSEYSSHFIRDGKMEFNTEELASLITGVGDLADELITGATGNGIKGDNRYTLDDGLKILDAAIEVNVTPALMDNAKKIGGRLKNVLGIKAAVKLTPTPEAQPSSISSSGKDTASTT